MMQASAELRLGVIGSGARRNLANCLHRPGEGSRLVAAADVDPEALERFRKKAGADTFVTADYREVLARTDVDAVLVLSPDDRHEEHAVAALEARKPVYLEKPMAITIEACDRILEAAARTGTKLYVGHNMRHAPFVLKMKELLAAGLIGPVQAVWCRHFIAYGGDAYFKDWHSERRHTTSLLLQKAAHDIDVIHWLAGAYTATVVGMGRLSVYDKCARRKPDEAGDASWCVENWPPLAQRDLSPNIDVEDHSMILMQLDNGVQCCYLQCHYTPDSCRNYTFIGTQGRIENRGSNGNAVVEARTVRRNGYGDPDAIHETERVAGGHGGADPRTAAEFIRYIREGIATHTSPVAARYAVAAGVMGTQSLRNGSTPQSIPPLDKALARHFEREQRSPTGDPSC